MIRGGAAPDITSAILADLFDALWLEDVAGFQSRAILGPAALDQTRDYALALGPGHLRARVTPDGWREGVRLAGAVHYETASARNELGAAGLLDLVLSGLPDLAPPVAERTRLQLGGILAQRDLWETSAQALEADVLAGRPLACERLAAWQDRPFHPLARARQGMSPTEVLAYGAEAGRLFALSWCAVARTLLSASPKAERSGPAVSLLDGPQKAMLDAEMANRGLAASHIALPVHPWQATHVLPERFEQEILAGHLVILDFQGPLVAATASLRTLVLPGQPGLHLKLPLDVQTLSVRRLLTPQSLHNGLHGADLLAAGLRRDSWLSRHVALADEAAFWHFAERDGDVYAERPALLGCTIRRLPAEGGLTVPLASLAVAPRGGLPPAIRLIAGDRPDLQALFASVAELVLGTALRGACYGFAPELHGQNALITFVEGRPRCLVLRDHDTVRCAPVWLEEAGLPVPAYLITDPQRNTLLLRRPEDLLAYAQTLAIDVALRAVAEAFAAAESNFDLRDARRILVAQVRRVLRDVDVPSSRKALISGLLLDERSAPFKQLLTPLLASSMPSTSMPSRLARAPNPLFLGVPQ